LFVTVSDVNHSVRFGNTSVSISNDRELDFDLVLTMSDDITNPFFVRFDGIDGQRSDETVHFMQLVLLEGKFTNFGSADWGEVGRMRKENGPFAYTFRERRIENNKVLEHSKIKINSTQRTRAICSI
jgi:hypothetical protein